SAPSIEIPTIVVTTVYPGASPDDIESVVTQPLEQEMSGVNDIDELRSTSTEGVSTIVAEFDPSMNNDKAYQDVKDAVDRAQSDLPSGIEEDPIVSEINTEDFPIMSVNLGADYSLSRLKEVGEDLQDEIEGVPSILEANLVGGLTREVQVNVDQTALQGYGLTFQDLVDTIQRENRNIPGGSVDVDRLSYLIRVDGRFDDPEEQIPDLVVGAPNGNPVYVRDVADVVFGFEDRSTYARLRTLQEENAEGELVSADRNDESVPVISLNVTKRGGDNILEAVDSVKETIDEFDFPSGTRVTITSDESENVESLVTDLENNIISGLLFVVAVLLFFLGVRNATLVGIAIPLSMFTTFLYFQALGYTLNFVVLFSLIIALGMLVDNAIVVVENIYRFMEAGYSRWEAAKRGTAEVGGAVVAATATTVVAFAPMLFWPGVIGEFMSFLPLTLIITLICSLFVALVINPVVSGMFIRIETNGTTDESEETSWPTAPRYLAGAGILVLGLVLGLANWKTLVVVAVAVPTLYALHTYLLKPIGDRFAKEGLPRLIAWYRDFLRFMLERDYSRPRALLRNTGALGAFSAGVALCALGGIVAGLASLTAGSVLLVPGGLLLAVGTLGIVVHTVEGMYLGGRASVWIGGVLGALMLLFLGIALWLGRIDLLSFSIMMAAPVVIALVGAAGMAFGGGRTHLLLTDHRALLLNGALGTLLLIGGLYALAPTGVSFFPNTDPNRVQVILDNPVGTNVETTNRTAQAAEQRLDDLMEQTAAVGANIENILTNVGVGGDSQFGGGADREERARLSLNMVDYEDRAESSTQTLDRLRNQLVGIPGTEIDFQQETPGPPTGPPVNVEVSGPDFDRIVSISREIKSRLNEAASDGTIPGLVDVTDDLDAGRPELRVEVDRERANQFGLSTEQVASTVRAAIQGQEASTFRDGKDEYDITVRLEEEDRATLESLRNLTLSTPTGEQVPVVSVADLEESTGFGSITRLDEERVVTVEGDAAPGYNDNAVLEQVQQLLDDYEQELPSQYELTYTGQNEDQQESFGFLFTALAIGVALILLVMITEFNSVSAPFIIMAAVGLSLIGVVLGLVLTRTPFSLFTFIGVISLAGIVVNNNIVLVDYIMQLRQRGLQKQEAIIEGGATRLRPVLLTALTTILGLVPLTFGINVDFVGLLTDFAPNFQFGSENTQFWGPMGTAIIAGLTFGTFLTLVIVPVMYSTFDSVSQRVTALFGAAPEAGSIITEAVATDGGTASAPDQAEAPTSNVPLDNGRSDDSPTPSVDR
ncbi:MAG: efflux RND transporter permease subunit, partial [Salinivenus sp.]